MNYYDLLKSGLANKQNMLLINEKVESFPHIQIAFCSFSPAVN